MASSKDNFVLRTYIAATFSVIILTADLSFGAVPTEHLYMDHVICQFNPAYTKNSYCKLDFIDRMHKSFSSTCNVTQRLDNVLGFAQLYHKFRSGYSIFLIDVDINLCDYASKKTKSIIIDTILPKLVHHFKLSPGQNLSCPFTGMFDVVKLPLLGDLFNNQFIPVGDYIINLTATTASHDYIWNAKFFFTIPEGKTVEDDRMGR